MRGEEVRSQVNKKYTAEVAENIFSYLNSSLSVSLW